MGIIKGILVALATLGTLFGGHTQPVTLGSAVPSIQALFETSLQASITSNATSATLVSGTDLAGNNLSGYYCFTIDAGTVQNEFVCGNASGTALTNLVRGVNPALGITANTSLQFAHRRGADVKMTDAPYLSIYSNIFNGTQGIPGTLYYDSHPTSTASTTIVDKNYVDTSVIGGGVPATNGVPGFQFQATTSQLQASTQSGSYNTQTYPYAVNAGSVASTSRANSIPLTNASGTLDPSFISTSTNYGFGNQTLNGTTTLANATSGLLQTNASGSISIAGQGASTSSLLSYYNGKWNAGVYQAVQVATSSASGNVATTTLPSISVNGKYFITLNYFSHNTDTNTNTTTITLYDGTNSLVLNTFAQALSTGGSSGIYCTAAIELDMLNSTSVQTGSVRNICLSANNGGYLGVQQTTNTAFTPISSGFTGFNFGGNTYIKIGQTQAYAITVTSTVMVIQ